MIYKCRYAHFGNFNDMRFQYLEGNSMINYNKLWHKLVDLKMNKSQLRMASGISTSTLAKLGKNELVSLEVLEKICETLDCDLGDIASFIDEDETENE